MALSNWNDKPFSDRVTALYTAAFTANVETKMRNTGNESPNEVLIIAERGSQEHGVWDYRNSGTGVAIAPYKIESTSVGKLKYYLVP